MRIMDDDIGSHQYRIGKKSGIHVFGLRADLFLESGRPFQFSHISIHVQQKVEFRDFRHIALDIQRGDSGSMPAARYSASTCRTLL